MNESLHRTLWRSDFASVPPFERRVARYALHLYREGRRTFLDLSSNEILAALWQLTLPLLDPDALADFRQRVLQKAGKSRSDRHRNPENAVAILLDTVVAEDELTDWEESFDLELLSELRRPVRTLFETLPPRVLTRLAAADETGPTAAVANLGAALNLSTPEISILDYLEHRGLSSPFRLLLRAGRHTAIGSRSIARINRERLAAMLGQTVQEVKAALAKRGSLRSLGLVDCDSDESDLEDFLTPTELLREVLDAAPESPEALLELLIEPAPAAVWQLEAFPQLADSARRLQAVLRRATAQGASGINVLFYGPPGTGKTELARAVAAASGLRAYQVRSADEDDDGLNRRGRLSAYQIAQRLLARRHDAVLIFDEVEDVFESSDNLFALLRGRAATGCQKGWMNRMLEENPVPAIWITNATDGMDPAFLRRFLLPVAFTAPPRSVRRQMAESHLGDCPVPPTLLDELAEDAALAPAQLGAARRLIDLQPDDPAEQTVRAGVAALRTLLHGSPAPRRRRQGTTFDVAYLNLAGGILPRAMVRALERNGHGSLCFYGPPGTGKTAFAEVLAEALDRELVVRQASDLISPYIGETEQNLARLFRECDPALTVLLLDEVDSFLADRREARHSWERTQVNELLQQMERYPGIFIAATNLMSGIDAAALRRFDFKLQFRPLNSVQRVSLFAREVCGDARAPVPPELVRSLDTLHNLTPGDFATVCRQRALLGETLTPEQFLRRLAMECRLKQAEPLLET